MTRIARVLSGQRPIRHLLFFSPLHSRRTTAFPPLHRNFATTAPTMASDSAPARHKREDPGQTTSADLEPHEMTSEDSKTEDPYYPKGIQHESRGMHDTTTTHEDEEALKRRAGNEWRDQPPYRTESDNYTFKKTHEAQCNCGRIKYWLSEDKPLASKYCHCTDCQSLHGT